MIVECAWCGVEMRHCLSLVPQPKSHGMCQDCFDSITREFNNAKTWGDGEEGKLTISKEDGDKLLKERDSSIFEPFPDSVQGLSGLR